MASGLAPAGAVLSGCVGVEPERVGPDRHALRAASAFASALQAPAPGSPCSASLVTFRNVPYKFAPVVVPHMLSNKRLAYTL